MSTDKVSLNRQDVHRVLQAFLGPQHHVLELHAIRVPYINNPVDRLVREYNEAVAVAPVPVETRQVVFEARSHERDSDGGTMRLLRSSEHLALEINVPKASHVVPLAPAMAQTFKAALEASLERREAPASSILPVGVRRTTYGDPYQEVVQIFVRRDEQRAVVELSKYDAAALVKALEPPPKPAPQMTMDLGQPSM